MSYLLGYQKWRKLHESAKYRKIYEEDETGSSAKPIRFALYTRTDTAVFTDAMLRDYLKWTQVPSNIATGSSNIAVWEISLKDAMLGNWSTAVRGTEVWSNAKGAPTAQNRSIRDTFECEGLSLKGNKVSGKLHYDPNKDLKIRASGNGLLALHRVYLTLQLESKATNKPIEQLIQGPGMIIIEFNYADPTGDLSAEAGAREGSRIGQMFSFEKSGFLIQKQMTYTFLGNSTDYIANLSYYASTSETETEERKAKTKKLFDSLSKESAWRKSNQPLDYYFSIRSRVRSLPEKTIDPEIIKNEYKKIIKDNQQYVQKGNQNIANLSESDVIFYYLNSFAQYDKTNGGNLGFSPKDIPLDNQPNSIVRASSPLVTFFKSGFLEGAKIYIKDELSKLRFSEQYISELVEGLGLGVSSAVNNIAAELQIPGSYTQEEFKKNVRAFLNIWRGGLTLAGIELPQTKPQTTAATRGFSSGNQAEGSGETQAPPQTTGSPTPSNKK